MDRTEFRNGLRAFRALVDGLERIVADPEAIARMQRRALEHPEILLGPTLEDYFGLGSADSVGSGPLPDSEEF
jgi:hypothetical protein